MSMYPPNTLLDERYLVERQIGEGSFAEVYLARDDRGEGNMVALKISKNSYGNQEKENKFLNEAQNLFNLRHEHIIRLLDYRILEHKPALVMEYMPYTLNERYKPEGKSQRPCPPEEILSYLQQAAGALQFAHDHDIVHQDIKPANILLDNDNLLKVSDFNISVLMQDIAVSKKLGGTEGYIAPEGYASQAADQYALGVVVYEGLLGHKPGFWISPRSLISRLFPASHVSAVLPIVLRALSKDPVKRFSDIQTFANQFEEAYKQATHDTSNRLKRRFVVALAACLLVLISLGIPLLSLSQAVSHTSIGHVQTSTPNFQATQTAAVQLYQRYTSSVPDIDATLKDQDSNEWQVITSSTSSCVFTNGAYQASTQQVQTYMPCLEQAKMCKNCAFQVELMIVKGYYGGVTVRADPVQQTGYYFMIGPDDSYKFGVLNGRVSHSLRSGLSPVINNKANQWNQLTVITRNNQLSFYINQRYIDQVSDSTFLQGMVGMVAEDLSDADGLSHPAQVMFRNVRLWSLP